MPTLTQMTRIAPKSFIVIVLYKMLLQCNHGCLAFSFFLSFFLYFFLFLVFLTRWWFKDRLCNPNVTVTLRCQRAPLSSLFSLSFPVHTVQWTAPVAGQDVKESHVPDWNCMGNHPDWLVSCYPLVGVAQNCITVTSVEIACCKPNEQEGTVQSLTYLKAEITHAW